MYSVYVLFSARLSKYYIGQTRNLDDRLRRHNAGYEKATSPGRPWKLELSVTKESRSEAMILERKLKNLSRKRLLEFIAKNIDSVAGQ